MLVAGIIATMSAVAIGATRQAVERYRMVGAARYVAARMQRARSEAVSRSASVAVRFSDSAQTVGFSVYVDGNRNGVLSSDIGSGVDREIGGRTDLTAFAGVTFGLMSGLISPEGDSLQGDPVRFGPARMAVFTPSGTATAGSVYLRGPGTEQYVVRVYGDTGKTSILRFDARRRLWTALS